MREIDKQEMLKIEGGTNTTLIVSIIGVIVTFFVGVFHGYANPKSCNN